MNNHAVHWRGYAMILTAALCFGSYGVWSRIMGQDFGIFFQGWVRSIIILLFLVPYMVATKSFCKIERKDLSWMTVCMLFSIMTQVPIYYAFNHTDIGTATLIFYSLFVITSYMVGRLFLGETITRIKMLAMLLAFSGLVLIFGFSLAKFSILGLAMAALNGVASGGEVSTSKKLTGQYPSLMITFWSWLLIVITHLPLSLLTHEKQYVPSFNANWGAMLLYALAGLFGFWLVIEGFKFVDASIGSLVGLLEIIFSVSFGILFFKEHLTVTIFTGGLLIVLAAMLPDLLNILQHKRVSEPVEPAREF